jgi:hypothetical protein
MFITFICKSRHKLTIKSHSRTHMYMMNSLVKTVSSYVDDMCQLLSNDDLSTNCSKTAAWATEVRSARECVTHNQM